MNPRRFALIGGFVMLAFGVLAFIPQLSQDALQANLPVLRLEDSYGLFLNFFPMNVLNKVALIAFGVGGIFASSLRGTSLPASIKFSRWVFVVMGVATILGLFPATNTLFGYWPLYGNEVLAHGVFALLGAYFGFALSMKVPKVDSLPGAKQDPHAHGI